MEILRMTNIVGMENNARMALAWKVNSTREKLLK